MAGQHCPRRRGSSASGARSARRSRRREGRERAAVPRSRAGSRRRGDAAGAAPALVGGGERGAASPAASCRSSGSARLAAPLSTTTDIGNGEAGFGDGGGEDDAAHAGGAGDGGPASGGRLPQSGATMTPGGRHRRAAAAGAADFVAPLGSEREDAAVAFAQGPADRGGDRRRRHRADRRAGRQIVSTGNCRPSERTTGAPPRSAATRPPSRVAGHDEQAQLRVGARPRFEGEREAEIGVEAAFGEPGRNDEADAVEGGVVLKAAGEEWPRSAPSMRVASETFTSWRTR